LVVTTYRAHEWLFSKKPTTGHEKLRHPKRVHHVWLDPVARCSFSSMQLRLLVDSQRPLELTNEISGSSEEDNQQEE